MIDIKYYGIKVPPEELGQDLHGSYHARESYIFCIATSTTNAWLNFFDKNYCRAPLCEAIKAYEAIGYKCVELEIKEKNEPVDN